MSRTLAWRSVVSRAAGVLALVAGLVLVTASSASAHAVFVSMTPADGSLSSVPPTQVVVTFNEPIQSVGAAVVVHAPSGASVADGTPVVVDNTITQKLAPLTEQGTYSVAFRVTSSDGHPVTKELTFAYGSRTASTQTPAPQASSSGGLVPLLVVAAIAVVLLGAGLVLVRRRSSAPVPPSA